MFNHFSGPRGLTQKGQAGFNAGVIDKAVDFDTPPHLFPAAFCDEVNENFFQCNAVERIF